MQEVRFDDLPALQRLVSAEFSPFGPALEITQTMIDHFAKLTRDDQWIHTDEARARQQSPYRATIAHGFLLLSLIPHLTRDIGDRRVVGFGSVINYGADNLRFVSAVRSAALVHARRRLVHVRRKGPVGTQLTNEVEVWVVGGERPAVSYRSLALFLP